MNVVVVAASVPSCPRGTRSAHTHTAGRPRPRPPPPPPSSTKPPGLAVHLAVLRLIKQGKSTHTHTYTHAHTQHAARTAHGTATAAQMPLEPTTDPHPRPHQQPCTEPPTGSGCGLAVGQCGRWGRGARGQARPSYQATMYARAAARPAPPQPAAPAAHRLLPATVQASCSPAGRSTRILTPPQGTCIPPVWTDAARACGSAPEGHTKAGDPARRSVEPS